LKAGEEAENVYWPEGSAHVVKLVDAFYLPGKGNKKGRAVFGLETSEKEGGEYLLLSERDQLRPILEMGIGAIVEITPTEKVELENGNTLWKFRLRKKAGTGDAKRTAGALIAKSKKERRAKREEEAEEVGGEDIPF
jgi:hypothetical protein